MRKRGRSLKNILKGVYTGVKELAREGAPGLGDWLFKEIGGLGGLSIFRRMDTLFLAARKAENRIAQYRAPAPERHYSAPRGKGGKGGNRGKGSGFARERDMSRVICYSCFQPGHMRINCPNGGSKSPPSAQS